MNTYQVYKQKYKQEKVDKKITGIIHWLERLNKSYSEGALENALMDAECAKADLEVLRRDVWNRVQPKNYVPRFSFVNFLMSCLRTTSLTILIVLLAVVPISKDVKANVVELNQLETLETLEKNITPKSVKNTPKIPAKNKKIAQISAKNSTKNPTKNSTLKNPEKTLQLAQKSEQKNEKQKSVPYDKVFSLIQTGERALRNESYIVINN